MYHFLPSAFISIPPARYHRNETAHPSLTSFSVVTRILSSFCRDSHGWKRRARSRYWKAKLSYTRDVTGETPARLERKGSKESKWDSIPLTLTLWAGIIKDYQISRCQSSINQPVRADTSFSSSLSLPLSFVPASLTLRPGIIVGFHRNISEMFRRLPSTGVYAEYSEDEQRDDVVK